MTIAKVSSHAFGVVLGVSFSLMLMAFTVLFYLPPALITGYAIEYLSQNGMTYKWLWLIIPPAVCISPAICYLVIAPLIDRFEKPIRKFERRAVAHCTEEHIWVGMLLLGLIVLIMATP